MARNGICDFCDVGSGKVRWRDVNWCDRWYELIWYKLRRCGLMALLSKGFLSKDAIERSLLTWHYRIVPSKTAFFWNRYYGQVFFFFFFFFKRGCWNWHYALVFFQKRFSATDIMDWSFFKRRLFGIGIMDWSFLRNGFLKSALWGGLFLRNGFFEVAIIL